jgi:uncharacterized metal-binding protein YceD (DUF177 family)
MTDSVPLPLSRPIDITSIRSDGSNYHVETTEAERAALAARFEIPAIASLTADFVLRKKGPHIRATGVVFGRFTQECILTLEPFETDFREEVDVGFDENPAKALELRPEEEAPDQIVDGIVDLGALAGEFTALALDPYPRKPGAVFEFADKKDVGDDKPAPFGALADLKSPE